MESEGFNCSYHENEDYHNSWLPGLNERIVIENIDFLSCGRHKSTGLFTSTNTVITFVIENDKVVEHFIDVIHSGL